LQTCSRCHTQSPDTTLVCPSCGADLKGLSTTGEALRKFQENPRVRMVNVIVHADACPACQEIQGTYPIDQAPKIPVEGCSHEHGCRCFYQPVLEEIFP
jgi:RNA polymerase subunit RPABC4/transcription elongation factor Spt4